MISPNETLFKALGLFIDAFRLYAISLLTKAHGDKWPAEYAQKLGMGQRDNWDKGLRNGIAPEQLIDFGNVRSFALGFKDLLKPDFGKETNNLATWLDDITDARNKCNHYNTADLTPEAVTNAFYNMTRIADKTGMTDLKDSLKRLQQPVEAPPATSSSPASPTPTPVTPSQTDPAPDAAPIPVRPSTTGPTAWFNIVRPHDDIRRGHLDESVFAANLADVAQDLGPEVYRNPSLFFEKTYPTAGLRTVADRVIKGLNGGQDADNRVISLQTGFGGGKTHTLISLYHLAKMGSQATQFQTTKALLDQIGQPTFSNASIAVFTNTTNDPSQGRTVEPGLTLRTLWGELAYQLGGRAAYELIRVNDETRVAPKGLFKQVLAHVQPALLLVDELADYCISASGVAVGGLTLADQTTSFLQELTESVAASERCVLVATLPASVAEVASSPNAAQILGSLQARMARVGADTKPVADDEIYEVVRQRLFEDMGDETERGAVISAYMEQYRKMRAELPAEATQAKYRELLRKSYPFHPSLMDVFHKRWASHSDFQRTRGVLRLLGSIVSDLWNRRQSLPGSNGLIHPSDVNFANLDALTGQMKKLYGNGYDAVLPADVVGSGSNAGRIDSERADFGRHGLTQGIATTILLNSFGATGSRQGIGVDELKLAVMKPASFNHNDVNAVLDALEANAYYLYYSSNPRRYWFFTKPSLNILVSHARHEITPPAVQQEILKRLNDRKANIQTFTTLIEPADDMPEQLKPTLIVFGPDKPATNDSDGVSRKALDRIERIATQRGNNQRLYRNTLLFLLPAQAGLGKLTECVTAYLANQRVSADYGSQLDSEQRTDLKKRIDTAGQDIEKTLAATYSVVVKYSAKNGISKVEANQFRDTVDAQVNGVLVPLLKEGSQDICLLDKVSYNTLQKANLLPTPTQPIQTKDICEAFLRYDDKDMITGPQAVQESLLRYCSNGEYAIAAGDGKEFRRIFYQEAVPHFDVQDATYWLVDKSLYQPQPAAPAPGGEGVDPEPPQPSVVGEDGQPKPGPNPISGPRPINTVMVHGKVDIANYSQVFQTFIMPLAQNGVEIEIRIKGKSTAAKPLTETSAEYKVIIEGARQLGLDVDES